MGGQGGGADQAKVLSEAIRETSRVKDEINSTLSAADRVMRRIKSGTPQFDFANTPKTLGKLEALWHEFDGTLTEFDREMLIQDMRTMKLDHGKNTDLFVDCLRGFSLKKAHASKLQEATEIIVNQANAQRVSQRTGKRKRG